MKSLASALLVVLLTLFNGCASSQTDVTGASGPQPAGAVPGETVPDDQRIEPGGFGNPGPNVRW